MSKENDPFVGAVMATLCFLMRDSQVLLARKMKKIGIGWWNGYGGRQEKGESIAEAATRELFEETGYQVVAKIDDLELSAIVEFHNHKEDGSQFLVKVHVFLVRNWQGEAQATDEMEEPAWFALDNLPTEEMFVGDSYWLPLVLSGQKVKGRFVYGPGQKTMLADPELVIVETL